MDKNLIGGSTVLMLLALLEEKDCYGYEIIRKDIEKDFRERLFDRVARNMDAEYVFQSRDSLLTEEEIQISKDRTKPWGTIHAVLCAKDVVKTPFAVINSDDYYGRSLTWLSLSPTKIQNPSN